MKLFWEAGCGDGRATRWHGHDIMGFFHYDDLTDALDRFPENERDSVRRSVHKSLVKKDAKYRRFRNIHFGITALFLIALQGCDTVLDKLRMPYSLMAHYCLLAIVIVVYLAWCITIQGYMNRRVAEEIRTQPMDERERACNSGAPREPREFVAPVAPEVKLWMLLAERSWPEPPTSPSPQSPFGDAAGR